ncbi:helix-turn-helix domain-containing protein [Methylophaga sp.]|uniref:helix-turn-helix domain-containing protein n=1 Tax=Methylophaga sp. TaxID=2024840 RepID=UPI003A920E41
MTEQAWHKKTKKLLKQKKITMSELGEKLGFAQSSISMKLIGKRETSLDEAINIAAILEVSLSELINEDEKLLTDDDEQTIIETYRNLTAPEKSLFLKLVAAFKAE